jgi:poly-gamma-glutamate synthesis protein (capsule biosynthesis protein)
VFILKKLYILILFLVVLLAAYGWGNLFKQKNIEQSSNVSKSNVTLFFTGDVMLGRGVDGILSNGRNVFQNVEPSFKNSDGAIINLEGPFTTSSSNFKQNIPLKANPNYAHVLKDNNIVVACLANNHIMDYGSKGLADTISSLKSSGVNYTGAGDNLEQATKLVYLNVKGRKITVLNFMDNKTFTEFSASEMAAATSNSSGYAPADWNTIKNRIDEAKNNSDATVVVFHYGNEYSTSPNTSQIELSHKCIDEGADMVIGSHAHVIQKVESYNGKPIFYSLGNFVFDQSNPNTHSSLMVEMQLVGNEAKVTVHPMVLVGSIPRPMDNTSGIQLLNKLKSQSSLNMTIEGGNGVLTFPL